MGPFYSPKAQVSCPNSLSGPLRQLSLQRLSDLPQCNEEAFRRPPLLQGPHVLLLQHSKLCCVT